MPQITVIVNHPAGLHARPASLFVQTANRFSCDLLVTHKNKSVNAKSILGVLTLGVYQGAEIQIFADGKDAPSALHALKNLIETDFCREEK